MLVFSRKEKQIIRIFDDIQIKVIEIKEGIVRIGIEAPKEIPVHREEVYQAILARGGDLNIKADA